MRNEIRLVFAGVLSLVLVVAVAAIPTTPGTVARSAVVIDQTAPQAQSVSGIIAAVDKGSFTLTLQQPSHNVNASENAAQQDAPKSMTFVVDTNTTIEGTLQVGASADVTYRDDENGNHMAMGVRVR